MLSPFFLTLKRKCFNAMPNLLHSNLCYIMRLRKVSKLVLAENIKSLTDVKTNVSGGPLGAKLKNLLGTWSPLPWKSCVFVISVVKWWKMYYTYIFFTQSTKDFDKLKRNMSDGSVVFLTYLLIFLTWKVLLFFFFLISFWYISCFKQRVYFSLSS